MCSLRFASALFLVSVGFAVMASPSPQPQSEPSVVEPNSKHVYAWLPDDTIRRLSPGPGFYVQPCVDPEGKGAVFWGGAERRPRIWFHDFAENATRPMTPADIGSMQPSFDWQGRRIVFASDAAASTPHLDLLVISGASPPREDVREAQVNLFVMDVDGTNLRQITHGAFRDSRPAFSPDGRSVAFLSNRGGKGNGLYVAPVDGSVEPTRILQETGVGRPWFSADGKFIYFFLFSVPDEHRRISRVSVEGGPWVLVTPDGLPRSHGGFADPDGIHLWFHSTRFFGTRDQTTAPYRFNLQTEELERLMPPGFGTAGHVSRSRNGIITFDSRELDPPGGS